MSVLAPLAANQCPTCRADHDHLDAFWACPKHGHKLGAPTADGDWEHRRCPAPRCEYTRSAPLPPRNPAKGDPMTALNTRPSVAVDAMYDQAKRLKELLPAGLDNSSFFGSASSALYNNADLMAAAENDPASFMIALTECAALGHMPGSKDYYLTPRGKGGKRNATVLGIEGYRGIVERMYRSGQVGKVTWREVCASDSFHFTEGMDYPEHEFANGGRTGAAFFSAQRGDMVGVYAYARLLSGGYTRVALLSRDDVFARRADGGWKEDDRYSPWNRLDGGPDHPEFRGRSMWWKSALKAAEPSTPTSAEDKREQRPATMRAEQVQERPSVTLNAAPPPAAAVAQDKRQALPAGRQKPARRDVKAAKPANGDVVTKALWAAIDQQFGRIGVEDQTERENWVRRLNQDAEGELTADQLRFALATLGEKDGDDHVIGDVAALVELCDPGTAAEPVEDEIEVPF